MAELEYQQIPYLPQDVPTQDNEKQYLLSQALFTNGRQEFQKEYDKLKSEKGPLNGAVINLNSFASNKQQVISKYTAMLEKALTDLQEKSFNADATKQIPQKGHPGKLITAWDGTKDFFGSSNGVLGDMQNIIEAIEGIDKIVQSAGPGGIMNAKNWQNIRNKFLKTKNGQMRAFAERLSSGQDIKAADYESFMKAIGGGFGRDLGYAMEDILTLLIQELGEDQDFIKQLEAHVAGTLSSVSSSNRKGVSPTAVPGTIRAFLSDVDSTSGKQKIPTGKPLRDTTITFNFEGGGSSTYGVSVKRYNFSRYGNNEISISVGALSMINFSGIMAQLDSSSTPLLTLYRVYAASKIENNQPAYYLAAKALPSIYKGRKLDGQSDLNNIDDSVDIMIINGVMMDVSTYMNRTTGKVVTSGLPKYDGKWIPDEKIPSMIDRIHSSKIHVYATISSAAQLLRT